LQYTQTIMGPGRSGGAGMRVTGRKAQPGESSAVGRRAQATKYQRANSSSAARNPMVTEPMPKEAGAPKIDGGFFSSSGRPRADSAPMPMHLGLPGTNGAPAMTGTSMMNPARLGVGGVDSGAGLLEQAMSFSGGSEDVEETDRDETEEGARDFSNLGLGRYDPGESSTGAAESARPSDMGITAGDSAGPLGQATIDEGSDVDETEFEEDMVDALDQQDDGVLDRRKGSAERRSSGDTMNEAPLDFAPITLNPRPQTSALTAILNKHIPHLVSTASAPSMASISNPFTSLYASVSAPSAAPSVSLELYFPHSSEPTDPLRCKVRKDATVEEATGYGLFKYWEDGREPRLSEEEGEERWSTVGWGLRIVEDDGEVDEDFPREYGLFRLHTLTNHAALDRDSQVSKFSYGQFAIVTATDAQSQ